MLHLVSATGHAHRSRCSSYMPIARCDGDEPSDGGDDEPEDGDHQNEREEGGAGDHEKRGYGGKFKTD